MRDFHAVGRAQRCGRCHHGARVCLLLGACAYRISFWALLFVVLARVIRIRVLVSAFGGAPFALRVQHVMSGTIVAIIIITT